MNGTAAHPRRRRSLDGVTMVSRQRAAEPRAATLIYRQLLDDIVSLRRKPMELLNEKELAASFGVSRTPVREAVMRLCNDGLVDVFPQSGTFVSRISRRRLHEAILIRKSLENTTVGLAMERMSASGLGKLDSIQAAFSAAARAGDHDGFHNLDNAFHRQINEIAGFPGIWTLVCQTNVHLDRYRLLTLPLQGRVSRVVDEHGAIIEAMHRADMAAAVAAMDFHLGQMLGDIGNMTEFDPAFFMDDHEAAIREPDMTGP